MTFIVWHKDESKNSFYRPMIEYAEKASKTNNVSTLVVTNSNMKVCCILNANNAKELFDLIKDPYKVRQVEDNTIHFIIHNYKVTKNFRDTIKRLYIQHSTPTFIKHL
jgi:hypothetical protein